MDNEDILEEDTPITLTYGKLIELTLKAQQRGYEKGLSDGKKDATPGGPLFPGWQFVPSCQCRGNVTKTWETTCNGGGCGSPSPENAPSL